MPTVAFAPALTRHVACSPQRVEALTLRAALDAAFRAAPALRGYVLDEQGAVRDPGRAWFAPAHSDAQRMPVGGRMVVNETRDGGASFTSHGEGLPQRAAYHLVYRHALEAGADGELLAMGSTTGGLWISEDAGAAWHCVSRDLPPIAVLRWV